MSVTSNAFPVNHSNSIMPPTTTSSSSIISAPVVFSSSQLPASVGTSDISHGCNSQFRYLLLTLLLRMCLPAYHFYLLQEVPLSSHHLKLYQSMETSCHLSLDSQGRRTRPNQELILIGWNNLTTLAGWDEHTKLVNLTTCLRGTAYSFYRSCASEQRSNYKLLVEQLSKCFTPVELTAIQSQCFHDHHQTAKESVGEFAQELKKLFHKAYSNLTRGSSEAEAMGQSVLANQFVSGLQPELKSKVVSF